MASQHSEGSPSTESPLARPGRVLKDITEQIGNTPIVQFNRITSLVPNVVAKRILGKLESEEPMKSVKDRIGLAMITYLEERGELQPGGTIVEATSGNTGIALAQIAAVKGYKCILTMPESMSMERRAVLIALGAEVVLTPAAKGMKGAKAKCDQIARDTGAIIPRQFESPANPAIHERTTGPEIWRDTAGGQFDIFVSGVGTGGTITGVGRYLRSKGWTGQLVAVEPDESPVLSGGTPGPHKIQGIGAGFKPDVLDLSLVNEIVRVKSEDAIETSKQLSLQEGLFLGISSGAAVRAALILGARPENAGKTILAVMPSFGERYLSTLLFQWAIDKAKALPVDPVDF